MTVHYSLPIPTRDEIQNSSVPADASYTAAKERPASPVIEHPSEELEKALASTQLGVRRH